MAVVGTDQITIIDLTDGYSVFMSPESYAFPADTAHALRGDVTLRMSALQGSDSIPVTIGDITHSAGATELQKFGVLVTNNGTANPSIKISVLAEGTVADPGYIDVPCAVGDGVTIVKRFVYSLAKAGESGSSGVSPFNVVVGMDGITIPSTSAGLTKSEATITIPWGAYQGDQRVAATVAVTGLPAGMSVSTNTAASKTADGSLVIAVANGSALGGNSSGTFTMTFTVGTNEFVRYFSWAKAIGGTDGSDGEDAVVLAVTSSAGTIFKSSVVTTTLTANVFKGGTQIKYADLATHFGTGAAIKWYKDGVYDSTGESLAVNGTLVAHKAVFEARLEV